MHAALRKLILQDPLTKLPWLIVAAFLIVVVLTFRDYGITWDESVQAQYGELVLAYLASGFTDKRCNDYKDLRYYGPLFETATSILYQTFHLGKYETRHLCTALTAILAVIAVICYARLIDPRAAPVFAAGALILLPRFYGHAFNNSKDMPFAGMFALSMLAIGAMVRRQAFGPRQALVIGGAIGVTLAIRVGGVLLFIYLLTAAVYAVFVRPRDDAPETPFRLRPMMFLNGGLLVLSAWILMVSIWPWAHENPFTRPLEAVRMSAAFHHTYQVVFAGRIMDSSQLPWFYLPWYLVITTPPPVLILALLGIGYGVGDIVADPRSDRAALSCLTLLWILLPIGYFAISRPNVYDGIRHFLFVLPGVAILAGAGASRLLMRIRQPACKRLACGVLLLAMVTTIPSLVRLHPYQTTFFNFFVGGTGTAGYYYDTDYWASSYKEAMEWVNCRAAESAERPLRVLLAANDYARACADYYRSPDVELETMYGVAEGGALPAPYDYYIATYRYGLAANYPQSPIVRVIGRQGAVFTVIRRR